MRVHQVAAKHGLIYFANRSRDIVIDELVERHWNYNLDICNTFEELRDRALDVPQTTKELLELGKVIFCLFFSLSFSLNNLFLARRKETFLFRIKVRVLQLLLRFRINVCNIYSHFYSHRSPCKVNERIFDAGQYMLAATSTVLMELQEKMYLSLRMLTSLLEMTSLSRHHIELNTTTVQWFKRIKPIFERSSSMYEQMKFDLEEKLQEEVEILSHRVEGMFPR